MSLREMSVILAKVIDMTRPWYVNDLVVFDLETTGVDRENDRAVTASLGLLPAEDSAAEPESYSWLINPGIEIPEEAAAVHGITTEYAREHGGDPKVALGDIVGTMAMLLGQLPGYPLTNGDGPRPLVAYNSPFDLTMLDRECRRHDIRSPLEHLKLLVVDPLVIDKAADKYVKGKGQRQLTPTCARYGIELKDAHDAAADATACGQLARAIARKHVQIATASLQQLQEWQRFWHERDTKSLAAYFRRMAASVAEPDHSELVAKAESCEADAGHWPYRLIDSPTLPG